MRRILHHIRWRYMRAATSLAAARRLDRDKLRFIAREIAPGERTRNYALQGRTLRLTHHTEDIAAFKEIFVLGIYDLPEDWLQKSPQLVLDVGGNIGMFGLRAAINWPGASIVAFEPEPSSAAAYRRLISDNAIKCQLVEACAGARVGTVQFTTGKHIFAHITNDGSGLPVHMVDFFAYLDASVDLVKMDIEGGEWEILLDPRFRAAPPESILLEYHQHLCPGRDPKEFVSNLLSSIGYTQIEHLTWSEKYRAGELRARLREAVDHVER